MNLLHKFTLFKAFLFIFGKDKNVYKFILKNFKLSNSQIFQDLFVLHQLKSKKNGFFIEIGVGNGKIWSNTYILEKKYKWRGILCEADSRMHTIIKKHRNSKLISLPISDKCNNQYKFYENIKTPYNSSSKILPGSQCKITKSMCLEHVLSKNEAPKNIDYVSIDTEGNEYDIIKNFNFKKWKIKTLTIEHNFNQEYRKKIYALLQKNKYIRVCKNISYMDDWYILDEKP